jgi:hypothetical protein
VRVNVKELNEKKKKLTERKFLNNPTSMVCSKILLTLNNKNMQNHGERMTEFDRC